jgi:nitroreductase
MNQFFDILSHLIENRRTTKPHLLNGRKIADEDIQKLLQLADWAPTHGHTEPWHFHIFAGDKVLQFCSDHAILYQQQTDPEKFDQAKFDKLQHMGDLASHIIVASMKRGNLPKIPALEEIAAASCAIQNLLLGATALGIASYWGSGGMAYHPAMKSFLKLGEEDVVLGILYLGYSDKTERTGKRMIPLEEKITWM